MELTKVNNNTSGVPRYVVHFLNLISVRDSETIKEWHYASIQLRHKHSIEFEYDYALKKAKTIGGRKFHNKQYGGGIVFTTYNTENLINKLRNLLNTPIQNFK